MLLSGTLFALFMMGFWLYCLTDAILTPTAECRGMAKPHLDDPADGHFRTGQWTDADEAVARHPAGRARAAGTGRTAPKGPDDDPEFLRALDRAIRGNSQAGEEV